MDEFPFGTERPTLAPGVQRVFAPLESVALEDMDAFALLNRVDTKFLLTIEQTEQIFDAIGRHYRILEINGVRAGHYRTLYFDTPDLAMYMAHHNGNRERYKVRVRKYLDTNVSYFEIKRKSNHERTLKLRMLTPKLSRVLDEPTGAFLRAHTPYTPESMVPRVINDFLRVSLVGLDDIERITLDFAISMALDEEIVAMPRLVIAEVKQHKLAMSSPFVRAVHAIHVGPMSFSKYCYAIAALNPTARRNRFKERILYANRILNRGGCS